ncbi:MAG: TonB-dependent receptor plug domain-containing protein, partial [Cyclobacteriaceae bacterium]
MVNLFTHLRGDGIVVMLSLLLLVTPSYIFAQQSIDGVIVDDETSDPIPGVNILIKGTTTGAVSDISGAFRLNASPNDILVVSFVGYGTKEIGIGNQSTINIRLVPDVTALEEIVVTGYTSQSTRSITGAASVLGSEELEQIPVVSLDRALQGRTPGVAVTNTGLPGGPTVVRVRGFGTLNSNDPLYVIDGVPVQGDLTSLSPADIESIVILKDAAAASVYGNRAANGVIVVTTKSGKPGKTSFSASVNIGVNNIPDSRFPDFVNPQQLADAIRTSQINAGQPFSHAQYGSGTQAILPDFINPPGTFLDGNNIVDANGNVVTTLDQYDLNDNNGDGIFQLMRANQQGTDWFDETIDPGIFQAYNITASGGSEKGTYLFGGGYYNEEGVVLGTEFTRYSSRFNSTANITDWLRVGENVNLTYSEREGEDPDNINQNVNGSFANVWRM